MRTITATVRGWEAKKDSRTAGVKGEGNCTNLIISFDETWDGFAKTVTWLDARGENPVKVTLTADKLVDLLTDTRTYQIQIPSEPLAHAGKCTAVLDGYSDGVRSRSVPMIFEVVDAPYYADASEPVDPTPTQAEQLQEQIDTLLDDMQDIANEAKSYAVGGTGTRTGEDTDNAKYYSEVATSAKDAAEAAQEGAEEAETNAGISATNAANSAAGAAGSASQAASSASDAAESASKAATSASQASGSATSAKGYADSAEGYASAAESSASQALSHKQDAEQAATEAQGYLDTVKADADRASQAASSAESDAKDAEGYKTSALDSSTAAASSAQQAQSSAEAAAESAQTAQSAVGKTSYIGENGNWYEWQVDKFVDSGVPATSLLDENSGGRIRMWFGTLAQYNDLSEIRSDTYYNILEGAP